MKIKTIVWMGIIICLLLLALPASASDYTLGIFGNANEDDTINMQDVTYTELIILEYKDPTKLADAKYDSEIDILDVTQIELIILGREKELTFIDDADDVVTINKPVERVVNKHWAIDDAMRILNVADRIVAVEMNTKEQTLYFPELSKLPCFGEGFGFIDYEQILNLHPDVFIVRYAGKCQSPLPFEKGLEL